MLLLPTTAAVGTTIEGAIRRGTAAAAKPLDRDDVRIRNMMIDE